MSLQYLTNINPPPTQSALEYDVEPNTVFVSTGTEPMYADLTVTVSNTTNTAINCMKFQFGFLAGAQTGNLSTAAEATSVTASSQQNEWTITPNGSFSGSNPHLFLFTATPSGIDNYLSLAAGASLVFQISNILVDQSVGEGNAPFTIIEQTGKSNPTKQIAQGTLPINKGVGALSITAFNVDPPTPVTPGTPVELSWGLTGSNHWQLYDSNTATLLYDSNTSTPPNLTEWPVTPEQTTTYELIAWAGQLFTARSAEAMVASPQVAAEGPSTPVDALSDVIIRWTSSNAHTIGIEPTGQTANATSGHGQFTVQPTANTPYTLTAYDANNKPGPTPATVEVYVNPPQITPLTASSQSCLAGQSVNLSWKTKSASSASLSQSILGGGTNNLGSVDLNNSAYPVTPTGISTYILTAISQGQATSQVLVAEVTPISVPGACQAIAYDAVNNLIWVVSQSGATLTGLNPADGSVSRQPISLPQAEYVALISVGNYLWVAFYPTVMQIEASTGQVVRQIPINNDEPSALVYDHVNNLIWVTDQSKGTLTRIDASTGAIVGNLVGVGSNPNSVVFDGTNIWSADDYDGSVKLVPASREQNITSTTIPGLTGILELAFDGNNVWGADGSGVMKFDSQGKVIASPPVGYGANGMFTDGVHLWTANFGTNDGSVSMLRVADATVLGTFPVTPIAPRPQIIVFDGKCVWLTETWNYTLTKV